MSISYNVSYYTVHQWLPVGCGLRAQSTNVCARTVAGLGMSDFVAFGNCAEVVFGNFVYREHSCKATELDKKECNEDS